MARGDDYDDEVEEDDEEYEEEEEEEEEYEEERGKKRGRGSQFIDDAAEEDEDEDEEDEAPRKKKGSTTGRSMFIEEEAAVASDDEEEEEEEEDGFIDRDADLGEELGNERPSAHHRTLLRRNEEEEEVNEEDYQRFLEERYARNEVPELGEGEATEVEQQALLPSVRDPKLWMVKCELGHEREAVVSLMQKCVNLEALGQNLQIKSAIALDNLKGCVYVEAYKEAYVKEACAGLRLLRAWKPALVPIKEMAGVLTVEQKSVDLEENSWVRVKIGLYKGDLALVTDVDTVKQRATIKLIPRIDLQALAQRQDNKPVVKRKARPAPRFFSVDEAKNYGLRPMVTRHRTTGEHIQSIEGMQFVDGYLLKVVSIKSLDTRGVVPTLDELQRFQRAAGDGERGEYGGGGAGLGSGVGPMGLSAEQANRQRGRLVKGDVVEVVEGDLKGLKGRVEKVDDDEVIIRPHHDELKDLLPVKESQLRKFFQTGDHVKVVAGQNDGVTGMIVKVEGHIAIVLSDTSREHVRVFTRDLMSSSEVTAGPSQIGDYELHDLVLLESRVGACPCCPSQCCPSQCCPFNPLSVPSVHPPPRSQTTAGVIVKVEKTGCVVLKATPERSETVAVKLREIRRKMNNRHVSAHDAEGLPVVAKDPVRVVEGTYRDRRGTVEHIHRGVLFVFDRHHVENGGFFCVRARSVRCLTAKAAAATGLSIPVIVFSPVDSPSLSQRNSAGAGGGGGASTMAPLIRSFGGGGGGGAMAPFDRRFGGVMQSPSRFLQSPRNFPGSPSRQGGGRGGGPPPGAYGGGRMGNRRESGMVGRIVKIRAGPYKGYRGRVLDATDTTARIELESQMKVVTVRRDQLPDGAPAAGQQQQSPAPYRESPRFRGSLGSETPVHPSRTPMHPGFGGRGFDPSATPVHEGMRTPMRDRAWNPHVPTTPLRPDSFDEANPSTWGSSGSDAPFLPYTPAFSPADIAASPPLPVHDPGTPGDLRSAFDIPTPGSQAGPNYNPSTPYGEAPSPYAAQTPTGQPLTPSAAYIPATPADSSLPMTPADPNSPAIGMGGGFSNGGEGGSLGLPGVLVMVRRQGGPGMTTVVIREVLPDGSCRVGASNASESELFIVGPSEMDIVLPRSHDRVKILRGPLRGAVGKLMGVDAAEGIVKVDGEPDVKTIEITGLGKLQHACCDDYLGEPLFRHAVRATEAEIKALGGLEVLVPGKLEPTLIRQHLDESLLKAFNCACNVHLSTSYAYQALGLYCGKDSVALRGFGKFFWKRSLEEQMTFKDIASFVSGRGGTLMLRDIKAPPQSFHDPERGDALTIAEYDLALGKVAYEKDLNLHKAAEMSGDAGAQNFIENRLLKPAMLAIQRCARYVTQIRRVGKGTGEYQMDHHMLMGVDVGELTVGQVLDPMTERMSVHMQPPTKRARTAADGIVGLLSSED
ncbi:unnamed protein product [Closterium sp. NIES-54]